MAFVYASVIGVVWLLSWAGKNTERQKSNVLFMRLRSQLINLAFRKLMGMSRFMIRSQEAGKIINMFSTNFNRSEMKFVYIFKVAIYPFVFVSILLLMIIRLGWPGVISPVVIVIGFWAQLKISKMGVSLLKKADRLEDKRVKCIGEILGNVRSIKLYGL